MAEIVKWEPPIPEILFTDRWNPAPVSDGGMRVEDYWVEVRFGSRLLDVKVKFMIQESGYWRNTKWRKDDGELVERRIKKTAKIVASVREGMTWAELGAVVKEQVLKWTPTDRKAYVRVRVERSIDDEGEGEDLSQAQPEVPSSRSAPVPIPEQVVDVAPEHPAHAIKRKILEFEGPAAEVLAELEIVLKDKPELLARAKNMLEMQRMRLFGTDLVDQ